MAQVFKERRQRQRISTMLLCEIKAPGVGPCLVRIRDLTNLGVRIACPDSFKGQRFVRVRMPGTEDWANAQVIWCRGGMAGLAFHRPIDLPAIPERRIVGQ